MFVYLFQKRRIDHEILRASYRIYPATHSQALHFLPSQPGGSFVDSF
jgi:hypothetical protein